jgi:GWxTD domain-containing protein
MKKIFTLLLFLFITVFPQNKMDFEFDYAQFSYDSTSNFVEFYYSFNQASLKAELSDSQKVLEGVLKIFIKDSDKGDTLVYNQWLIKHDVVDTTDLMSQILVGTIGFVLPKGKLQCEVSGIDLHNKENIRTINEVINVVPFLDHHLAVSDIQLASKMIQGSENVNSIFYKNTYEIMPIPNLVFGKTQPAMFFYTELYNLQDEDLKNSTLKLDQLLFNSRGKFVKGKTKEISRATTSRVEVGSFILTTLPTDTYTLTITIVDTLIKKGVSTSKKFFIYNPDVAPEEVSDISTTAAISSIFGAMSEEELDDLYMKSKYISTLSEIEKYQKINTIEGKREFMSQFWKARDEDTQTPENEYFNNYMQRIQLCNQRYTTMGKQGWRTDRGRVFLLYGEPTEIERYPNQLETRPYEIWQYTEIEGGVYFVFADLTGFSDYELVHSTKRGELRDDNWSRRITIN